MDGRTFVKGTGGFVLFVAASTVAGPSLIKKATQLQPENERIYRGPCLSDTLTYARTGDGISAYVGDAHVFDANSLGAKLLMLADGEHSLDEIVAQLDGEVDPVEASLFYIEVGKAGYLQNRVEVALVEHTT